MAAIVRPLKRITAAARMCCEASSRSCRVCRIGSVSGWGERLSVMRQQRIQQLRCSVQYQICASALQLFTLAEAAQYAGRLRPGPAPGVNVDRGIADHEALRS